ncbi:MAG TPA: hypothetical protein VHY79_20050, partial [Rhizomicrobium sp.]|nr:hypothetical protein [Rhizomicrobium sp.]
MSYTPRKTIYRGLNPMQFGISSELSFYHACEFIYRADCPIFQSNGEIFTAAECVAATTDPKELRRQHDQAPERDYRGRAMPGDSLFAV